MNALAKLKEQARNHELREEWRQAASAYLQVLRQAEEGEVSELALYNRVGDLYLRMGEGDEAVNYYEQAADHYAEAGLFNNAIALCNKALRYAPTRMDLLRKLGHFSASQGFLTDARRWFLEYSERAIRAGDMDGAVAALDDYARVAGDAEARELVARKLLAAGRKEVALKEYRRAHGMRVSDGEMEVAEALLAEMREKFPDEDFEDPVPTAPDPADRWRAEPEPERKPVSTAPTDGAAKADGPDLAPPVGLPGFDDRPDPQDATTAAAAGPLAGFELTSLSEPEAVADKDGVEAQPEGLETTRLAGAPILGARPGTNGTEAPASGTEAPAENPDDMDWVRARHGRQAPAAAAPPESPPVDYVDLSDLLGIGEDEDKETRWFIEEHEPTGDEDRDFAELLGQFKEKLAEHIAHDDAGAHYDLGIAFKEMGLLDEAIGQFQIALRGNGTRLKIMEELGHCFFLKNHHSVAIKVLKRALELETNDELEMIGVYYYLGRAYEEQGHQEQARDAYERVVGLDIGFQDVADRMTRL